MKMRTHVFAVFMTLLSISSSPTQASVSNQIKLLGKITSFDEKNITVKSGEKFYTFSKEELKYPVYKVGDDVEIATTLEKLKSIKHSMPQK